MVSLVQGRGLHAVPPRSLGLQERRQGPSSHVAPCSLLSAAHTSAMTSGRHILGNKRGICHLLPEMS